jgi:iron(III) transport system substrate-binding protein
VSSYLGALPLRRLLVGPLVAGALAVAVLPACSTGGGDRLLVYSGRSKELIGPLLARFAEESGVKIDVKYGDSADLALTIDEEGDRTKVDVFISQSPGATAYLDGKERLAKLPEAVTDLVPEEDHASDGNWVGLTGRVRVLVYNKDLVSADELPESVFDLTGPVYKGKVGVAPTNGSFQDFVTAARRDVGDDQMAEWLDGMAANDSPTYPNNVAIVEAVAAGDLEMGLVNHYYIAQAKAEDPDTLAEVHYFPEGDSGSLLLVTAAARPKASDQTDDAEELIEFLLSERSQEYFATETQEYPLVDGVEPDKGIPPLDEVNVTRIELDDLGGGLPQTQKLIEESGLGS